MGLRALLKQLSKYGAASSSRPYRWLFPHRPYCGSSGEAVLLPKVSHDWGFDAAVSLKLHPKADTDDRPLLAEFGRSLPQFSLPAVDEQRKNFPTRRQTEWVGSVSSPDRQAALQRDFRLNGR